MSKVEYADDAALVEADAATATARVTALAAGSITDAAMVISQAKSATLRSKTSTRSSIWGRECSVTALTALTVFIEWPSHKLYSARSPTAYGQTIGCRAARRS